LTLLDLIFFVNYGGIENRKVLDSLELFATHVMPCSRASSRPCRNGVEGQGGACASQCLRAARPQWPWGWHLGCTNVYWASRL